MERKDSPITSPRRTLYMTHYQVCPGQMHLQTADGRVGSVRAEQADKGLATLVLEVPLEPPIARIRGRADFALVGPGPLGIVGVLVRHVGHRGAAVDLLARVIAAYVVEHLVRVLVGAEIAAVGTPELAQLAAEAHVHAQRRLDAEGVAAAQAGVGSVGAGRRGRHRRCRWGWRRRYRWRRLGNVDLVGGVELVEVYEDAAGRCEQRGLMVSFGCARVAGVMVMVIGRVGGRVLGGGCFCTICSDGVNFRVPCGSRILLPR